MAQATLGMRESNQESSSTLRLQECLCPEILQGEPQRELGMEGGTLI